MLLDVDEEELPDQLENDFSDDGNRTASFSAFMNLCCQNSFSKLFLNDVIFCHCLTVLIKNNVTFCSSDDCDVSSTTSLAASSK